MRRGTLFLLSGTAATTMAIAVAACTTDYQKGLEDPRYGDPNALAGQKQPGSSTDYTVGSGGEGGASSGGIGGGYVCVKTGGSVVDGGACAVSFSKDVIGIFVASTCTDSACHGGASPPYQPRIDPTDLQATYDSFAALKMSVGGTPYINPCSTDKTQSGIACNLSATATCGTKMPSGGGQIADGDIQKIETWLTCGSPNN